MNIETYIENIDCASKEVFNIPIPKDRIKIFFQDYADYRRQMYTGLDKEVTARILSTNSLAFLDTIDIAEIRAEINSTRGFHSLRWDKGGLASDITVLLDSDTLNSPVSLQQTQAKYGLIEALSHEIGHAVMEYNIRRNMRERFTARRFAAAYGELNALHRSLYELLSEEEKKEFATRIVGSIDSHKKSIEFDTKIFALESVQKLYELQSDLQMLELSRRSLESAHQNAVWRKRQKEMNEKFRALSGQDAHEDAFMEDIRKILDDKEKKDIQKNTDDIITYQSKVEALKDEIKKKEEILDVLYRIPTASNALMSVWPKYQKSGKISLVHSEGWAVYYSNKIMESMVSQIFKRSNPKANPETLRTLFSMSPDNPELDKYPEVKTHVIRTYSWQNQNNAYGEGFKLYRLLDPGNAIRYAFRRM